MTYRIGGHIVSIIGDESLIVSALPSFAPFVISDEEAAGEPCLMRMTLCDTLQKAPDTRFLIDANTGNGITKVERLSDGGYQFTINNIAEEECALVQTSREFQDCRCTLLCSEDNYRFALNNALMLAYAFSSAYHDTLLIHASVVRHAGKAVAFTAKSGTGKSTQVGNWMCYIPNCDIINDDNPIVRIVDGVVTIYGSPWSGKTPCYRNTSAPLKAIALIKRDKHNEVKPMLPMIAFTTVLTSCSSMKWDEGIYPKICDTVKYIVEHIEVVALHCLPTGDSAHTCCKSLYYSKSAEQKQSQS